MFTTKAWFAALLFGALVADVIGKKPTAQNAVVCGEFKTKGECEKQRLGNEELEEKDRIPCYYDPEIIGEETPCVVDAVAVEKTYETGDGRRNIGRADSKVADKFRDDIPPPVNYDDFQKIALKVDVDNKNEMGNTGDGKRSINFNGLLLGLGGIGLGLGFNDPLFPECPVHVKFCYRVPCGGYGNNYMENNPKKCLSDPRCCYDYKLAYMKKIFGPKFMGGAPLCYYGATSKQWVYITNYFKPYNPWHGKFILEAFESFFNTNAYDFAGKFACESSFRRKAYPVGAKSKLQCNLVSGCWNEDLPEGHQCLMASDLIQNLFGRREVYPSLFTDDPADTKCSANWFQYGPKAYNRMPCGAGPAPLKISDILSNWCPVKECCLNYASLSKEEKSQFMSYYIFMQNFGSGAFSQLAMSPAQGGVPGMQNPFGGSQVPGQQTPYDPRIFYYLLSSSSVSDLSDIFCPYKQRFTSGIFPDFSEYTEGCCDIPKCYHKKKLVKRSYPYPYPQPQPTRRPTPAPVQAAWGAWEECRAACGTTGVRYRSCYVGNRQQPGLCPGPSSQQCTGNPCPIQYYWGQWTAAGPCSSTCGAGYMPYKRSCYGGGKEVDSYMCNGDAQKSDPCSLKPCAPVQYYWGQWTAAGPCSSTCGAGYMPYKRSCYGEGKEVNSYMCNGDAQKSDPCSLKPCAPEYSWGQEFAQLGPCSVTCGQGYAVWGAQCVSSTGEVVNSQLCRGQQSRQTRLCQVEDCPVAAEWGDWEPASECGATCGPRGLRIERRSCFVNGQKTDSSACEGDDERIQRCAAPDCPTEYFWTGYVTQACSLDSRGFCTRQRSRRCYEFVGGRYVLVTPQIKCGNTGTQAIPCDPQQCASGTGNY